MPSERKRKWPSLVPPIFGSNVVHRSGNREGNVRFGSKADIGERLMSALPPKADIG